MEDKSPSQDSVLILWTTGERETALQMVFMYAENALKQGWWGEVTLLVWGASVPLLTGDEVLRRGLAGLLDAGVKVLACRQCAENLGLADDLKALGVKVFYTGVFLTDWLKSGRPCLSV